MKSIRYAASSILFTNEIPKLPEDNEVFEIESEFDMDLYLYQ